MIKAVVFDLAEVLLRGLFGVEEYINSIIDANLQENSNHLRGEPLSALFRGELSEVEYWRTVKENGNWDASIRELRIAIRKNFGEIEGTRSVIKKVGRKYETGLISDHAEEWVKHCEVKFDYHKLFDERVYSFEISALKSEGKPFKVMSEKLGVKPEQCLFIDDLEQNVKAAKEMGMNALQFESVEQLRMDLVSEL